MTDEKLGKERLGEPSIFLNLGVTIVIASIIFLVIILILVLVLWVCKKAKVDQKWHDRIKNFKSKVFYNPIIRYFLLNALKLNMSAIVSMSLSSDSTDVAIAIALLVAINIIPVFLMSTLIMNRKQLHKAQIT